MKVTTRTFEVGETVLFRPGKGYPEREQVIVEVEREDDIVRLHLDDGDAINITPSWELT